jgi:N-acetylmuramoyl-L-alanine amidase
VHPALAEPCEHRELRVAVDIGHSPSQPGATSARGKKEYAFNKRFASELVKSAKSRGKLTLFLLGADSLELADRPQKAAQQKADLFLSIHHDAVNQKYINYWEYDGKKLEYSDHFNGFSLFTYRNNAQFSESYRVARLIGTNLTAAGQTPALHHAEPIPGENRPLLDERLGIYAAPFSVLRHSTMPAVLLEVGVIVNRQEEEKLDNEAYRSKIEDAVLKSLEQYCQTNH